MKKMRGVALIALTLSVLMLLSACGAGVKQADIGKLIDKNATYKSDAFLPTEAEEISGVADMTMTQTAGALALFSNEDEYVVYNAEKGKSVLKLAKPEEGEVYLTLRSKTIKGKEFAYIVVWNTDENDVVTTDLYDATGAKVASAAYEAFTESEADLVRFDGKCYRFAADGMMGEAFAFSVLNALPDIVAYNDDYYLAYEEARYVVYDKLMLPVSAFDVPAYATVNAATMLPDGDVLLQYYYELPDDAKQYDCIMDGTLDIDGDNGEYSMEKMTKMNFVTLLVNPKNGKAKELKCDYLLIGAKGNQLKDTEKSGLKLDKVAMLCTAVKIEDQRFTLSNRVMIAMDKNGGITEYTQNGARVVAVDMVATDRYVVTTDSHDYLVDGKGKMIGDVSNGTVFGKFILGDGKVYDMDLKLVADLDDIGYRIEGMMSDAIVLRESDGGITLFTKSGSTDHIEEDVMDVLIYDEYVVITTSGERAVYDQEGNCIISDSVDSTISREYVGDSAIILSVSKYVYGSGYTTTYYALTAKQ